jgi:hypothetical protein
MLLSSNLLIAIALAYGPLPALAHNVTQTVWGVFAYSIYGDSTPDVVYPPGKLTAYGASGVHTAGSSFRDRYVAMYPQALPQNLRVQDLSEYSLHQDEVSVLSAANLPAITSAQAFMQGLYPPFETSFGEPYVEPSSQLANGSHATYPLGGYQYPPIVTLDMPDPRAIVVDGQSECRIHKVLVHEYKTSPEAERIDRESEAFYTYLYENNLANVFQRSSVNYINACEISEYLEYQAMHNATLFQSLDRADTDRARWLADLYTFATNGNLSTAGTYSDATLRTVAGQTLAAQVLNSFESNIRHHGMRDKMGLVFGDYDPAVALASLMGLASPETANFYSRPTHGASLVFELFSWESDHPPAYPDSSDLHVRFLLHNGTDSYTKFTPYPLFGRSLSNIAMPLSEFRAQMGNIALGSREEWCQRCESPALFCSSPSDGTKCPSCPECDTTSAAVKGALIAFALFMGALIAADLVACAINKYRRSKSAGRLQASNKKASGSEVAWKGPGWADMATGNQEPGSVVQGQSQPGSWEMMQFGNSSQSSNTLILDEGEEWRLHSGLEPVRVRESV